MTTDTGIQADHLTDYERAVCYYTLPRVKSTVTIGLLAAYCVCLLEAIAALLFGVLTERAIWAEAGIFALAGLIVFGVVAFFIRALLSDIRLRRALAATKGVPDADPQADADGLPDPFEGHTLLCCPRDISGASFEIRDNQGELHYTVQREEDGQTLAIHAPAHQNSLKVSIDTWGGSFSLSQGAPTKVSVYREDKEVARLRRRFSLGASTVDIACLNLDNTNIQVRDRSFFKGEKMVGRVYYIRKQMYLDIEEGAFHDGILGFFVAMV